MSEAGIMASARTTAALALMVVLIGASQLARPGYSVDEEFTVFAVRGIHAHGLPILPSGLLYDRGVGYSYASAATGSELVGPRAISLLCAAASVWLAFTFITRIANAHAAIVGALLVATTSPFWATATSARFYAPFMALYLGTLLSMRSRWWLPALLACASRLTHELAFTLALVPVVCWLVDTPQRRSWLRSTVAIAAGLVVAQLMLFLLHYLAPASGETMVRRFFLWQVLNLFERPAGGQYAIPLVLMVIAWLIAPQRAWWPSVIALSLSAAIAAASIAAATNAAPLTIALVRSALFDGSRYPLDMFWHIAASTPLTLIAALVLLVVRAAGGGSAWPPAERALHGLWIGWVLWFGVIESGITTNYLLMPMVFMMLAIAVDLHAILINPSASSRRWFSAARRPAWAAVAGMVIVLGFDQWRGDGSLQARLEAARPTINAAGLDEVRAELQPGDRIACTDELGCLMLVGRIDRWLALDDFVRERFLVRRGDGPVTGVYTGAAAVFRPGELFAPDEDGRLRDRVVIVDIFKEYPIGNSRSWLPKAIEEDGLSVVPLLETPQLRVLAVTAPEAVARLQPSP